MKFFNRPEEVPIREIKKDDGTVHHIICEGIRRHTLYWDSNGIHCSCKECEINQGGIK